MAKSGILSGMDRGAAVLRAILGAVEKRGGSEENLTSLLNDPNRLERVAEAIFPPDPNQDLFGMFPWLNGFKTAESDPREFSEQDFAKGISFVPVTDQGCINTEQMRARAGELGVNYGADLARWLLSNQDKIPANLRGNNYIVFPGFLGISPDGRLCVAFLDWRVDRWILGFGHVGNVWRSAGRFVRPGNNLDSGS